MEYPTAARHVCHIDYQREASPPWKVGGFLEVLRDTS